MDTTEFNQLELQVDNLIHYLSQLKAENAMLREKLLQSTDKCGKLNEIQKSASKRINLIIGRLKEELHETG